MEDAKALQYEGIHCKLTIERPRPGVAVVRISGHDLGEFGDVALRELEKEIGITLLKLTEKFVQRLAVVPRSR